ncbi:MAG TPA: RNA methyltransferase [Bacteroidota bacterium]|nr:RNA methyltransferase [Bacteroidota bacterium]
MTRKLSHDEVARNRFTAHQLQEKERFPISVLLDNVRSLYNVGSVFRTADGARIAKLLLCGFTPFPPRKEIEKTALGATTTVPWKYFRHAEDAVQYLRNESIRLCIVEHTDRSKPYYRLDRRDFPLCLALGNEITGVTKEIVSAADLAIDIPMHGMKQSLNVAVACGIVVFDCLRIWNNGELSARH